MTIARIMTVYLRVSTGSDPCVSVDPLGSDLIDTHGLREQ